MSVLIFGGCGMIGSYVASDLCARGIEVVTFDRAQPCGILLECAGSIRSISGDVGDARQVRAAVEESKARRILHLAAVLGRACEQDPAAAMRINVQGTVNVLEAARDGAVERVRCDDFVNQSDRERTSRVEAFAAQTQRARVR